ncbi:large conductance mechanosensitive channel protein MscL [Pseudoroseomonas wenyumeiae]|uniref:Large-conductance mechanosensitive channel n=1 Tax=Teichococcus wenyumeiae TaxID=2478470 RepID=A0A3A9JKQ2_9PROT|nr:large conductance mechanosensitive channel protein MscL [Pseudoroseomonas wenyumeiae]RKK01128.1 large conductance mechanosensitive channel protein MscL [Pseudoroseomonas wenyumeiae]RMI20842.1 large conductance mechanosensitive channel protein MscL [Pseudoroseomonas wenyumeiae]
MKKPNIPLHEPAWLREFKAFIMRGNVVDLAVGIVIGAAFTGIVNSLVQDLINPLIGLLIGGVDFSNVFFVLSGERGPSLEATRQSGAAVLAVGVFINAIIKFLIVALAIFWLLHLLKRLHLRHENKAPSGPSAEEKLLMDIRDELKALRQGDTAPLPVRAAPAGEGDDG